MTLVRRPRMALSGLVALVVVFALAAAPIAGAASVDQHTSLIPYYSVVRDKPFAAFTETDLQSTSLIPYYSVVRDK